MFSHYIPIVAVLFSHSETIQKLVEIAGLGLCPRIVGVLPVPKTPSFDGCYKPAPDEFYGIGFTTLFALTIWLFNIAMENHHF